MPSLCAVWGRFSLGLGYSRGAQSNWTPLGAQTRKNIKNHELLKASSVRFAGVLGRLGRSWAVLRASLGRLGGVLGLSWERLRAS